jgi:Zn-dependent peptidase ImmA (M78 family)
MSQTAHANPELLVWARESINMTMEEAQRRIHQRVPEWETSNASPTIPQLRKASGVYKRPLAVFFLPEPPTTFHVPHDYRLVANEAERPLSPKFMVELRLAQFRRQVALELLDEDAVEDQATALIGSARTNASIARLANETRERLSGHVASRRKWRTRYDAWNSWKAGIEDLGILVFQIKGVDVHEVRGFALTDTPLPVIGVNNSDTPNARMFTLLHEFGHLLLGAAGVSNLREFPDAATQDERIESFCNRFAGEVLVPSEQLKEHKLLAHETEARSWFDHELDTLANDFFVSRAMLLRRLLDIGATTAEFYWANISELNKPPEKGESVPIPYHRRVLSAVGKPYARLVLSAFDREAITASDLSEYLGMKMRHLSKFREIVR